MREKITSVLRSGGGKLAERRHQEDTDANGRDITKIGVCGLHLCDSRLLLVASSCEYGNGHSGSIKCWEFIE
jgi:hypothetical protein